MKAKFRKLHIGERVLQGDYISAKENQRDYINGKTIPLTWAEWSNNILNNRGGWKLLHAHDYPVGEKVTKNFLIYVARRFT